MGGARDFFPTRSYSVFFVGQLTSFIADGLRTLVIPLLVYHLTGSGLALGVTYALEYAPYAIFSTIGGSLADRVDRRMLMIVCDAARFGVMVVFAVAFGAGMLSLWIVYVGMTLISIAGAVFVGGQATSVPYLVGVARAGPAVAGIVAAEEAGYMVAPPLGGALLGLAGPVTTLGIIAATYFASLTATASLPDLGPDVRRGLPSPLRILRDARDGFAFIAGHGALATLTWISGLVNFFSMIGYAAIVPYLKILFASSDAHVGLIFGLFSLVAIAASLCAGRLRGNIWRLLTFSLAVDTLAYIPVVAGNVLALAVAGLALSCAMAAFELALITAWRLRVIPAGSFGRVIGAVKVIALGGTVPGAMLGGFLSDHFGPRAPMLAAGLGYLCCTLVIGVAAYMRDRQAGTIREGAPGESAK